VIALNPSITSRFTQLSTIDDMLKELFIEQWNSNVSYDQYYAQCAPDQCSYIQTVQGNAIYIVTTIIGLVGGLLTVLQ
ncbi:unnamed protein product, partial [Didymodactylos carnosus]